MEILPKEFRRGSLATDIGDVCPLDLVKQACSVDSDDDDELLRQYMQSAKEWIQDNLSRPLDGYLWYISFNQGRKDSDALMLPMAPIYDVMAGETRIPYHTRNGFDAFVYWKDVKAFAVNGVLELSVETSWEGHIDKLKHVFLTLVAEFYRTREYSVKQVFIRNVASAALDTYRRTITLANE